MDYGTLVEQVLSGNQDVPDMVQETYTSAWEHFGELRDSQRQQEQLEDRPQDSQRK